MDKLVHWKNPSVWDVIKAYWRSNEKKSAYVLYITLVILTVSIVGVELMLNYWYNYFYNALQAYDQKGAIRLLFIFFGIAFAYIILAVVRYFVWQVFGLRWRRWLTEQFIGRWLHGRGYYYLETFDRQTDNPDQRIQDDVGALISSSIDLSISLVGSILSMCGYSYVLWSLSGNVLNVPLGSLGTWHIHGYLLWVAFIYCTIGTLITFKIGRPLIGLNFEQQRREATFRFAAMDLRSHAEQVALYRGEHHQKTILQRLFGGVLDNWYQIILRQTKLLSFTASFGQLSVALPLIVVMPIYFNKVVLLGGMMQSLRAFNSLQDALSFIVNAFPQIAQWRATGQRLTTFLEHIDEVEEDAKHERRLKIVSQDDNRISMRDVSIATPREEALLQKVTMEFEYGRDYLLEGKSGLGKSTLLRAIAGIWPFAKGEIALPRDTKIMYLPQKPYMPIGTLEEAILFPDEVDPQLAARLPSVLRDCHLEKFIPRLQETAPWSQQLSPGEQQRIAFARVLLHEPKWVFLDESTSMLDAANEKHLYQLLKTKLPSCTIVSVGHHVALEACHEEVIDMRQFGATTPA